MRRLTNQQRQALKNALTLLMSVFLFAGAFMGVPYLVKAMPGISPSAAGNVLSDSEAIAKDIPAFALGGGKHEESVPDLPPESGSDIESRPENESGPELPPPTPQDGDLFVTESNLCWYETGETPTLNMINRTDYSVDINDYIVKDFPINGKITTEPLVLVVHTHGSESYLHKGCDFYSPDDDFRSTEESETVVRVGDVLCQLLNSYGIPTLHDRTMHDVPNYTGSYNNSLAAIKEYLREYPSIKFVIDLHRDSVFDAAGNNIKPFTTIENKDCAQLMLVMGTNAQGIPHPNWRDNLAFAAYLQQQINDMYPTLARPINLRTAEFNQALTKGSIILEVGSCGNTIEEAENAITFFAQAYASLILEQLG